MFLQRGFGRRLLQRNALVLEPGGECFNDCGELDCAGGVAAKVAAPPDPDAYGVRQVALKQNVEGADSVGSFVDQPGFDGVNLIPG